MMENALLYEIDFAESESVNGGEIVTSDNLYLLADLLLVKTCPPVAVAVTLIKYVNSNYLIPNIEY